MAANRRYLAVLAGLAMIVCIYIFYLGSVCGTSAVSPGGWKEENGLRYYALADGTPAAGWQTLGGEQYYFNSDGTPLSGWQELEGKYYYFRDSGSMVTGWLSLEGKRCYLGEDGAAVTGPADIDGEYYIFDEAGMLASGVVEVDGRCYQADKNGKPLSGWAEGSYFDESGCAVTGWQTIGPFRYYFYDDGTPAAGKTEIGGETFYFASNGQEVPLVNPWNQLPADYTVELKNISENHRIAEYACDDYAEMIADCKAAGLAPAVCSSYRTQEYQQMLYDRKVKFYTGKGYSEEEAKEQAGHSVAVPGTSEHQLGLALDIIDNSNWNLDESQAKTATQQWLMEYSWRYGWILRYPDGKSDITGIIYEPWHYRYVGREVAAEIHDLGLCLEEYMELLTVG